MDKEQVLEVKELIKYGFSLESIATGFKIPIEEVEKLKRQIEEEKQPKQKETGNKKTKTEPEIIQKKSKEISTSRKEIQGMLKKYQEIFGEQIKEAQSKTSKGELSEKEFEDAIQKMNLLIGRLKNMGNLPKNQKRVELEKVINAYRRLIEDDLMKKAYRAESIEELKELSAKIPTKIYGVGSAEGYIRNNISADIEKIIEDLANGEIDIQCANEAVEAEARRKVESSKGSKFGLTLDGQRRQILTQIHTALREKADEYIIKSPSKAIKGLIELGGVDSIQAVTIVTQNFIERKEYGRALAICEISFKSPSDEEMRQVRLLKRQIKAAKLGDLARKMLSSEKSLEEREAEYETLKTAMKMEGINASQILIGKTNSGNIPIYLNKILVDEKQR